MGAKEGRLGLSEVEKLTSVARSVIAARGSVRKEGEYFVAAEPNAFGIPSVHTCPGRTEYCEQDCYAIASERRTATAIKLQKNLDILHEAETVEGMAEKLNEMIGDYRERADKLKIPLNKRRFRIHWSGDFETVDYARAFRVAMEANDDIQFFTFTRSFQEDVNVLPVLTGIKNLDLFLSVDQQNVDRACEAIKDAPDARVAYLVDYLDDADVLIEKMGRGDLINNRSRACPENMRDHKGKRKLPVISEKGGACSRCTYCIDKPKEWDVVFVKEGLKERPVEFSFDEPVPVVFKVKGKKVINPEEFETYLNPDPSAAQPIGELVLVAAQDPLF